MNDNAEDDNGFVKYGYISREFTVWCGKCNEWDQISEKNQTVAVEYFRSVGWKKTKAKGWICPNH